MVRGIVDLLFRFPFCSNFPHVDRVKCDVVRLSSLQGSLEFEGKQNSQIHLLKASTLVRAPAETLLLAASPPSAS